MRLWIKGPTSKCVTLPIKEKKYVTIFEYQLWDNDVITNLPLLKLYIIICYHVDSTNGILSVEYLPIKQNHWLHIGPSILYLLVTASSQYKKVG